MYTINLKTINDSALNKKAEQAAWEIASVLRAAISADNGINVVLAAYLLYKAASANHPMDYDYEKLLSTDYGLGDDLPMIISETFGKEEWEKLLTLTNQYSPEVLALTAFKTPVEYLTRYDGSGATPNSIIRLSRKILNVQPHEKVADICCGYGTFLCESALNEPEADYTGFEINPSRKLIAKIRTSLINSGIKVILQDAFDILEDEPKVSYDKIFSNYPFKMSLKFVGGGLKLVDRLSEKYPGVSRATSSDWVFNSLLCESLAEGGKAIGIMTNGSTWNTIDMPMRKYFIENGLVESVIALPAKMFSFSSIATTLIVLSKGNSGVRIVDATNICQQGRRYTEFSDTDIEEIFNALHKDTPYSKTISLGELRQNEYVLNLGRYLKEGLNFKNATPFEEVIKSITRGAPCNAQQLDEMASEVETNIQYLMLSNIQNGVIDNKLPFLSAIDEKLEKYCLKNNSLILSKNGSPYKIAVAKVSEGKKILANGNLYIIELDEDKVDPYYLQAFFGSDQGATVLQSISVGSTIPNIGIDKLKKVEIPIPSLEEQKRIAEKYQIVSDEIALYKIKIEKAMNRLHHIIDEESEG